MTEHVQKADTSHCGVFCVWLFFPRIIEVSSGTASACFLSGDKTPKLS